MDEDSGASARNGTLRCSSSGWETLSGQPHPVCFPRKLQFLFRKHIVPIAEVTLYSSLSLSRGKTMRRRTQPVHQDLSVPSSPPRDERFRADGKCR